MKRLYRSLGISLIALFFTFGVIVLSLGLGWLNPLLRDYTQRKLSSVLGRSVSIGMFQGNPLSSFQMMKVIIDEKENSHITFDAVVVQYRPLALLKGKVNIDSIHLISPKFFIRKKGIDKNNLHRGIQGILPTWLKGDLPLVVEVERVIVKDGEGFVKWDGRKDIIRKLNLMFGFKVGPFGYDIELFRFRSLLFDPPLVISNLTGVSLFRDGRLALDSLRLETEGSQVRLSGNVTQFSDPKFSLILQGDSISLSEMGQFLPGTWPKGKVQIKGEILGNNKNLTGKLQAKMGSASGHIWYDVELADREPVYNFLLEAKGVKLGEIFPSLQVNADFDLKLRLQGQGLDPLTARSSMTAIFSKFNFSEILVDTLNLKIHLKEGEVTGKFDTEGGIVGLKASLDRDVSNYTYDFNLNQLDLSKVFNGLGFRTDLTGKVRIQKPKHQGWIGKGEFYALKLGEYRIPRVSLQTEFLKKRIFIKQLTLGLPSGMGSLEAKGNINLGRLKGIGKLNPTFQLDLMALLDLKQIIGNSLFGETALIKGVCNGTGLYPDSLKTEIILEAEELEFLGVGLDQGRAIVRQEGMQVRLDSLVLVNLLGHLEGKGVIDFAKGMNLEVQGRIDRPRSVFGFLNQQVGGTPISFTGRVGGDLGKPEAIFDLKADSLNFQGIPMEGVSFQTKWSALQAGGISLRARTIQWGRRILKGIFMDVSQEENGVVFLVGNAPKGDDRVYLWGRAGPVAGGYFLDLDSLFFQVDRIALSNEGSGRILYHPKRGIKVEQFNLSGPAGKIRIHEHPDFQENVRVSFDEIDLRSWGFFLGTRNEVDGILNGEVLMKSFPSDPRVSADLQIKNGNFSNFRFERCLGKLSYMQERVVLDLELLQRKGTKAFLSGGLRLHSLTGDKPLQSEFDDLRLQSKGIDLVFLNPIFSDIKDLSGQMALDLMVKGTFGNPKVTGWMKAEGQVNVVPLGKTFSGILTEVRIDSGKVLIERVEAQTDYGWLSGSGVLKYDLTDIVKKGLSIRDFSFLLKAHNFSAFNLPKLRATLGMELQLIGDLEASRLTGQVELTEAEVQLFNFPEVIPNKDNFWTTSSFFQNLSADVRISASRQVWIRSSDLNVEIAGDLDFRKDNESSRIFGSLDSRRGQYLFQNKNFRIERGEIRFQGRPEMDPDLFILGKTKQRLISGDSAEFRVIVGGTLLYPQVGLESDREDLSEGDILSYLVLGRPAQDVPAFFIGQKDGGGPGFTEGATNLVMGLAANQLKRKIGERLNLDVVEIEAGGGSISRVRVGKYIGPKLFVSYAQEISTAGREVWIEYELFPQLTLEAHQEIGEEDQQERQSLGIYWNLDW